jgi:hypothetical protein
MCFRFGGLDFDQILERLFNRQNISQPYTTSTFWSTDGQLMNGHRLQKMTNMDVAKMNFPVLRSRINLIPLLIRLELRDEAPVLANYKKMTF